MVIHSIPGLFQPTSKTIRKASFHQLGVNDQRTRAERWCLGDPEGRAMDLARFFAGKDEFFPNA